MFPGAGAWLAIYVGDTKYCCILNMFSEKKIFFNVSHYKSMGANDPRGVASLGPGDWFAGIM